MSKFGWWSTRQAKQTGFHICKGLNGYDFVVTFTTSNPEVPAIYARKFRDIIYVGAVDRVLESVPAPHPEGFNEDDFDAQSEIYNTNIPPIKKAPPSVVNYRKTKKKIIIDLEL